VQRNWEGLVLKAFGGRDFRLTVLGAEPVGEHYHRLRVDGGGVLQAGGLHPTMWIRLWFEHGGKSYQRAYTLVDPDPATGEFSLEFAVHDGPAPRWAAAAKPGDTLDATLQGSAFTVPDPLPRRLYVVGDAASLPAVNSLLDAMPGVPATLWLEYAHDGEKDLPLRTRDQHTVHWVPRLDAGGHLVDTVCAALPAAEDGAYYWIAAEAASTRSLTRHVRRGLGVDRKHVSALGYWKAG
jgi:NADPH-dependent ferric siderophore reductase